MVQKSRFLTATIAAAAIAAMTSAAMTSAAQAQFLFFWERPADRPAARQTPPRKAPARHDASRRAPSQIPDFDSSPVGEKASFNDTARFLAGLQPSEASPLAKYTRDGYWQQHARSFDHSWRELENRRLSKIRAWSAQNLKDRKAPLYYMFSGPDLLYADAFYPNATTYIFAGLEPVGHIPQINARTYSALGNLRSSMGSSISLSFFITKNMQSQLRETSLSGTLPILMVYAARAGKTIKDISLVSIDNDGKLATVASANATRGVPGVKMVFGEPGKPEQTLYYFSTDISDSGLKNSGFLKFAEGFGPGDAMFKAASYLPHSGSFSQIRDFVLSKAQNIVQDDSGIPIHYFKRDQWTFHPFGRYLGPIALFPGRHQAQLDEIFRKGPVKPLDFGMGYRWRPNESNMLWAVRKEVLTPTVLRPSVPEPAAQAGPVAPAAPAAVPPQQEAKPVEAAPAAVPAPQPQQEAKPANEPAPAMPVQEAKPVEVKPVEVKPVEVKPADAKPAEAAAPAAAQPAVPPANAAEQSASSGEPVRR